jgi:transposase
MEKRKYTKEFQIEALNLAKELGNYSAAAKQLGISDSVLYVWRDKFKFSIDKSNIKTAAESINEAEEIKRLRKENEELKKVNYILKRAAAFFSQDHLK